MIGLYKAESCSSQPIQSPSDGKVHTWSSEVKERAILQKYSSDSTNRLNLMLCPSSQTPSSSSFPLSSSFHLSIHLEEQLHVSLQSSISEVSVDFVLLHVLDLDLGNTLAMLLPLQLDPQCCNLVLQNVITALQPAAQHTDCSSQPITLTYWMLLCAQVTYLCILTSYSAFCWLICC